MTMQSGASTVGAPRSGRVPAFESDDERGSAPLPAMGAQFPPRRPAIEQAADALPRGRILVVEHQPIVALDLQRTLREAGYRAIGPAVTLGEIQRLIEQGPIDCAVVDIDVNRRTPLPVADLLAFADVPFAFLTNRGAGEIPQRHADRPRVRKPYTKAELMAAVERAMRRRSGPAANDTAKPLVTPRPDWPRIFPQL